MNRTSRENDGALVPWQSSYVRLWVDDTQVLYYYLGYANGWIWYASDPWAPHNYANNTVICANLTAMGGKPCETVHS
jgi:hypothetical protein